jgi:hypothetical protein
MDDLERFVRSYEEHQPEDLETQLVIVLVEATETERRTASEWGHPVMHHALNIGYNRACNMASGAGRHYDALAFFNADCELRDGVIEGCYAHLQEPFVGVIGPRQVDGHGRITSAGVGGTHSRPQHRGWLGQDQGQWNDVLDCVTVSGSAYFIRRDVFDELATCPIFRAFAPDATAAWLDCFHFYGETWISYHAHAHGYKVRYAGDVPRMVHHFHKASPIGGPGEQNEPTDRARFRAACDAHGIEHN